MANEDAAELSALKSEHRHGSGHAAGRKPPLGSTIGWKFLRFLIIATAIVLIKILDPVDLDSIILAHSRHLVSTIIGTKWLYPRCSDQPLCPGHQYISVGLIDDHFVKARHEPPLEYREWAQIIQSLLNLHPRMLVLDLEIKAAMRPADKSEQLLVDALHRARSSGVPVILATVGENSNYRTLPCPDSSAFRLASGFAVKIACAATLVAPVSVWNPEPAVFYPQRIEDDQHQAYPSLAWAAFTLLSGRRPDDNHNGSEAGDDDLFLVWGHSMEDEGSQYLTTFSLADIPYNTGSSQPTSAVWMPVTGRVVFLARGDRNAKDDVRFDAFTDVLGVYTHATALDNLLTFGVEKVPRFKSGDVVGSIDADLILLLACTFSPVLVSFTTWLGPRVFKSESGRTALSLAHVVGKRAFDVLILLLPPIITLLIRPLILPPLRILLRRVLRPVALWCILPVAVYFILPISRYNALAVLVSVTVLEVLVNALEKGVHLLKWHDHGEAK